MTPRNYDTTQHKPYPRVTQVTIDYSQSGVPTVRYVEQLSVVDGDNKVQHLASAPVQRLLDLSKIQAPIQIVNPSTGADIPGMTVTIQQLMLGILAVLRADQKRLDGVNDESQPIT